MMRRPDSQAIPWRTVRHCLLWKRPDSMSPDRPRNPRRLDLPSMFLYFLTMPQLPQDTIRPLDINGLGGEDDFRPSILLP